MPEQKAEKDEAVSARQILKIFIGSPEVIEEGVATFLKAHPQHRISSQACTSHTYFAGRSYGDPIYRLSIELSIVFERTEPAP